MLRITFVDNTYWDDGNRTTARAERFATLAQVLSRQREVLRAGRYPTTSQVTGETLSRYVGRDDVRVLRWNGAVWHEVDDASAVELLGDVSKGIE